MFVKDITQEAKLSRSIYSQKNNKYNQQHLLMKSQNCK